MENPTPRVRNTGIDLLRIVCMFMIPLLHILGGGYLTLSRPPLSASYFVCECMEICCLCAVNCFGMISGYVTYGREVKYSSLMVRYAQVLFYTVPTTALFLIFRPDLVGIKDLIRALVPNSYPKAYWYFKSYFVLFFFMPYLNRAAARLDKRSFNGLLVTCVMVFSVLGTAEHTDLGELVNGFSVLWLMVMYLFGAYFAKFGTVMPWKNRTNLRIYLVSAAAAAALEFGLQLAASRILHRRVFDDYLLYYVSPFVVACGLGLFLFFANLQCGKKLTQFAQSFAPLTFGVYLFQEEPLLRSTFLVDRLAGVPDWNPLSVAALAVGLAILIWFAGVGIDWVRTQLFRAWKLNQRFADCEAFLKRQIGRIPYFQG